MGSYRSSKSVQGFSFGFVGHTAASVSTRCLLGDGYSVHLVSKACQWKKHILKAHHQYLAAGGVSLMHDEDQCG